MSSFWQRCVGLAILTVLAGIPLNSTVCAGLCSYMAAVGSPDQPSGCHDVPGHGDPGFQNATPDDCASHGAAAGDAAALKAVRADALLMSGLQAPSPVPSARLAQPPLSSPRPPGLLPRVTAPPAAPLPLRI